MGGTNRLKDRRKKVKIFTYSSTSLPARLRASCEYIPLPKATAPIGQATFSWSCNFIGSSNYSQSLPLEIYGCYYFKMLFILGWFSLNSTHTFIKSLQAPQCKYASISCRILAGSAGREKDLIKNYIDLLELQRITYS